MAVQTNEVKIDALLARFFTESTLKQLLKHHGSAPSILKELYSVINRFEIPFHGKTYGDLFEFSYAHLLKNYRNEYIYKNAIANKILLGVHSLNTSFMLQEFRVGSCKADTLVLNGTSNVYEIKSALDSLDRLKKQIDTYLQVFDMVHVITFPGQAEKIEKCVPKRVGLMELSQRNSISTIRPAKTGKKDISTSMLFDSLRKSEYRAIIKKHYGVVPNVPNTEDYKVCKEIFVTIKAGVAHDLAVIELKKRGGSLVLKDFVSSVPDYFKSLSLHAKFSEKEAVELKGLLSSKLCVV